MYEFLRNLFASEQPHLEKFNIIDPTAVGNNVRSITLAYTPSTDESPTSSVSLFWSDSKNKVYEKNFQDESQAQSLFAAMQSDLNQASVLTRAEKADAAAALVRSLLKRYAIYTDELVDGDPAPVTTTNASKKTALWKDYLQNVYESFEEFAGYDEMYGLHQRLGFHSAEEAWETNPRIQGSTNPADYKRIGESGLRMSKVQNPLVNKTAKVVMQNLFFETPEELMQYQEKIKGKAAPAKSTPDLGDFKDDLPGEEEKKPGLLDEPDDGLAPGSLSYEDYEKEKANEQKSLTKRIEHEVKEQVKSALETKIASTFGEKEDKLVDAMREMGRTWEEIKDYFIKSLKFDKDSVSAYIDALREAELGHEKPLAPKPPTDLVSPDTHDKLVEEIDHQFKEPEVKAPEEHEIPKQETAMQEIAIQDTEIQKLAQDPLETVPKPRSGTDSEMFPPVKFDETSDDLKDDPSASPDMGDSVSPEFSEVVSIGDKVYVMADYETGDTGYEATLVSKFKQEGDEYAVVEAGNSDLKEVPMRYIKKAFFGRLVRILTARKIQRELDETKKAKADLQAIQAEIKKLKLDLQAESRADADAWVRLWIENDEIEDDAKIQAIVKGSADADAAFEAVAARVTEMIHEKGYDDWKLQSVGSPDVKLDLDQVYTVIDDMFTREKERKSDEEWRALKDQLAKETDPEKRKALQTRMTELEDMASKSGKATVNKVAAPPEQVQQQAPGVLPAKEPVETTPPVPVEFKELKISPKDTKKKQIEMVSPELGKVIQEYDDAQASLNTLSIMVKEIKAKADADISKAEREGKKTDLQEKSRQLIQAIASGVEMAKDKVIRNDNELWSLIEKTKIIQYKVPPEELLEKIIKEYNLEAKGVREKIKQIENGAHALDQEIQKRELIKSPVPESEAQSSLMTSALSRFDKTASIWDTLSSLYDSVMNLLESIPGSDVPAEAAKDPQLPNQPQ